MRLYLFFLSCILCSSLHSQQSFNTTLLSRFDPPTSDLPSSSGVQFNDIWGFTTPEGKEIAILGNVRYVVFLDVTDPLNIVEVFRHAPGNTTFWRDFKTYEGFAYGVCDSCSEGLFIYDLSKFDCTGQITPVGSITAQFGQAHNIFIDEPNDRLYVVGLSSAIDVWIYDLQTDPANPTLITGINFNQVTGTSTNFYVHDIFVRDNIAYCSHGFPGLYIWDLNDISNPHGTGGSAPTVTLLADGNFNGFNHSSWLTEDGQYAINAEEVPAGENLISVDLTDLANGNISAATQFNHRLEPTGAPTPHNPFIRGDMLILSYYEDGLKVFDFADPTNPNIHAYYDTYTLNNGGYSSRGTEGAWGCYPFFPSGNILISDITFGMHVLSVNGMETCADGIMNQDETGIDCGGKYCLPCNNCFDGIQNQDETGIDCGGSICCTPCLSFPPPQLNDCDDVDLTITSDIINNRIEYYDDFVRTSGTVNQASPVNSSFHAGNFLELNPGFEVMQGAQLLLTIEGCL